MTEAAAEAATEAATQKYTLHEYSSSGNCFKIRLTAALLGLDLETKQYDILKGETRTPDFLANVNPNGRIPVLQVDDRFLPESNAACWYLAEGSALIPEDRFTRAEMLQWMFFEQYSHEPNVATLRFWMQFVGEANLSEQQKSQITAKRIAGAEALALMDSHLNKNHWMAGESISLADIVLFPYTHVADSGGFQLRDHTNICAWIKRIEALPGFIAMT